MQVPSPAFPSARFILHHELHPFNDSRQLSGTVIYSLTFSADGRWLVAGSGRPHMKVIDANSGRVARELQGSARSLSPWPCGESWVMGSAGKDAAVQLWDLADGQELPDWCLGGRPDWTTAATAMPDGRRVVTVEKDKCLYVWDVDSKTVIRSIALTLPGEFPTIAPVAINGHQLAVAVGQVMVFVDIQMGTEVRRIALDRIWALAATPDRSLLLAGVGGMVGGVVVIDARTGGVVRRMMGHNGRVMAVVATYDGKHIISAGTDKSIRVWELGSGEMVQNIPDAHQLAICALAMAPDVKQLASISSDQAVKLWRWGENY